MESEIKKYRYETSGVHSTLAFAVADTGYIYLEDMILNTQYVKADIIANNNSISEVDANYQAEEEIMSAFHSGNVYQYSDTYTVNTVALAHRFNLYTFKSQSSKYARIFHYVIDVTNNTCAIEAFQALTNKTVDEKAIIIKDSSKFIKTLGQKVYDECISKITTN